jgi:hypothetical protein
MAEPGRDPFAAKSVVVPVAYTAFEVVAGTSSVYTMLALPVGARNTPVRTSVLPIPAAQLAMLVIPFTTVGVVAESYAN